MCGQHAPSAVSQGEPSPSCHSPLLVSEAAGVLRPSAKADSGVGPDVPETSRRRAHSGGTTMTHPAIVKIGTERSLRRSERTSGRCERAAPALSQFGSWTKSSVRQAAFCTAITKHTRSGPRLGNGAFVYLKEIGSMYRHPSSGRTSTTRPWIAAMR